MLPESFAEGIYIVLVLACSEVAMVHMQRGGLASPMPTSCLPARHDVLALGVGLGTAVGALLETRLCVML